MYRELFSRYQKQLTLFANTEHGKAFLVDKWGGRIEKSDKVIKVTPDSFHVLKDFVKDKPIIQATFFPRSPYLSKFAETLTYLSIMEDFQDVRKFDGKRIAELGKHIYLAETPFNPDAHPETNSVDGYITRTVVTEETWATIIAGAGTTADDSAGVGGIRAEARTDNALDKFTQLYRSCIGFYTASLGAGVTISAAVESYYCTTSIRDNTIWFPIAVRLLNTTHTYTTALATGDMAAATFGTTAIATDKAITTDWTTSAYADYTITDLTTISKTGLTRHGLRLDYDCTGSLPTRSASYGSSVQMRANSSDVGSNKPKLVVTYTGGGVRSFGVIVA